MRIIVLNYFSRNALAVINGLDPSYEIVGGAIRGAWYRRAAELMRSRRVETIFRHADPRRDPGRATDELVAACREHRADAIVATGTEMTDFLSEVRPRILAETSTRVLVDDYARLGRLTDKWLCYELCQEAGVPMPKTAKLEPGYSLEGFRFPVVIKPRRLSASRGVAFFEREEDLRRHAPNGIEDFVVQEVIEGELHDSTSCSKNGQIAAMLTQKRVVTLYDFGGGGIINKTTHEPDLMDLTERLVQHLGWNGVLLLDFIRDPAGRPFLLEANPKFWGTTQLTLDAGLNYPQMLVDLFVHDQEPPAERPPYDVGVLYKWVFPEVIYHWFTPPRSPRRLLSRVYQTARRHGSKQRRSNIKPSYIPHLLGIVLNGSKL